MWGYLCAAFDIDSACRISQSSFFTSPLPARAAAVAGLEPGGGANALAIVVYPAATLDPVGAKGATHQISGQHAT
jgi:hypothetical protein